MPLDAPYGGTTLASASGSAPGASALLPNDFTQLWDDAKARYRNDTGQDLVDVPFAAELRACNSVDDVIHILDGHDEAFDAFRAHGKKFRKLIDPVVRILQLIMETGAEVAAVVGHAIVLSLGSYDPDLNI